MPTISPIAISAHAATSGSIGPASPSATASRSALDVAGPDALVVVAEDVGRDEPGLADDPVEPRMLRGELEVAAEAEQLRLEPRLPLRRRLRHRVADAAVQVAHELVEDLLLRREVEVERALRDAGRLGDLHDRRVVVAELAEHVLGRVEQALRASRRPSSRARGRSTPVTMSLTAPPPPRAAPASASCPCRSGESRRRSGRTSAP